MVVDLTNIFGAGNEPSQDWCDYNLSFVLSSGITTRPNTVVVNKFGYVNSTVTYGLSDFKNKIKGSNIENKHIAYYLNASFGSSGFVEFENTDDYSKISSSDGNLYINATTINYTSPQQKFKFNIISIIETMLGCPIPSANGSISDKIAWTKSNITSLRFKWSGIGNRSSKTVFGKYWNISNSQWSGNYSISTTDSPTLLTITNSSNPGNYQIDNEWYVSFLAYGGSDSIGSSLSTDYVSLEVFLANVNSGSDSQGGVVFDGVDDMCTISKADSLSLLGNDFTINLILSINDPSTYRQTLYSRQKTYESDVEVYIYRTSSNQLVFVYSNDGVNRSSISFSVTFNSKTIYDISFVRRGNSLYCYINSVLVGVGTLNGSLYKSAYNTIIGACSSFEQYGGGLSYENFLLGTIKKVLQYNRGLTLAEIQQNYKINK